MPFYDFFKNLLNIPSRNEEKQNYNNDPRDNQDYRNNFWGPNADQYEEMWRDAHDSYSGPEDEGTMRNFNVFTDPLEMHRYFEQQMNEMLKSFGGFFGANTFGFNELPGIAPPQPPSIEQPPQNGNLRDRFLKPGYENRNDLSKRDHVLDDRTINAGDLDELLKEKNPRHTPESEGVIAPYQQQPLLPRIRSFGQSMSSKTIRRPDGSVEIHKTIRDNAGNEENVVTRQMGDKQYTITIRTDKQGRQEKCEDLVNMDEKELPKFKDYWNRGNEVHQQPPTNDVDDLSRLFPYFDKFFK